MKLTAKGEYALRVVLYLAAYKGKGLLKLHVISEKEGISLPYLHQLVKNLKKDKILISSRGPGGGYALAKEPKEISVFQVLVSVGESMSAYQVSLDANTDNAEAIKNLFFNIDRKTMQQLDKPISELLNG